MTIYEIAKSALPQAIIVDTGELTLISPAYGVMIEIEHSVPPFGFTRVKSKTVIDTTVTEKTVTMGLKIPDNVIKTVLENYQYFI